MIFLKTVFPKWSPDGKGLIFYSTRSGKYEIWRNLNVDGSNSKLLTITNGSANNPKLGSRMENHNFL